MKLKTLFHMLGFKPKPREYGFEIHSFDFSQEGYVEYAQWLHPIERRKEFCQAEIDYLREFLAPGDVAIDVGAHTGDSTLPIALATRAEGRVLALEPNPYVFRVLAENAKLNPDKTNIIALPFAATPEDGPIEFEYSDPGFCNGGRHEGISPWRHAHPFKLTVDGRNLQNYLRTNHSDLIGRLRYVKTDAEGFDTQVLRSIRGLIEETRPYIKAEVYKYTNEFQRLEFYRLLADLDYKLHKIESETNYLGQSVDAGNLMTWTHYDVFCAPKERVAELKQAG
ncbi:MAG: hypothetical protein CMJ64_10820 [Planctomycetaceae bacterium]|jgi:FkbM family methyltransferase|nr:hypothetical protein [Planctomycetaceae bacterium]